MIVFGSCSVRLAIAVNVGDIVEIEVMLRATIKIKITAFILKIGSLSAKKIKHKINFTYMANLLLILGLIAISYLLRFILDAMRRKCFERLDDSISKVKLEDAWNIDRKIFTMGRFK